MAGCIHGGLASEFAKFQRSLAAEYLMWQSEIVKKYKRQDQFITHNFDFEWKKFGADIAQDGYSYGVQPDINHYEASKAVTIAGTDIYHPTQDDLTGAEIAFGGDSIRTLKDSSYLVLECQAQAFKYWTAVRGSCDCRDTVIWQVVPKGSCTGIGTPFMMDMRHTGKVF